MPRRMIVVMDYENVLRTGHSIFAADRKLTDCTIDPFRYASQIARIKNKGLSLTDSDRVEVTRVEVYRGWPDSRANPKGNSLNTRQKESWTRGHQGVVDVTLRPLRKVPRSNKWQEKGVDVLCALALVGASRSHQFEVVVLASRDSDLGPAIDEAFRERDPGVEVGAAKWYDPDVKESRGFLPAERSFPTVNLWRSEYEASLDPTPYMTRKERRQKQRENETSG